VHKKPSIGVPFRPLVDNLSDMDNATEMANVTELENASEMSA
jgi:hypothetical protein